MMRFRPVRHCVENSCLPSPSFVLFFRVRLVSEDGTFLSSQKFAEHFDVRCFCGRCLNRMYKTRIRIDTDMPLHAEVPLITFLRLAHRRITFLLFILRATGGGDKCGINDGALSHEVTFLRQKIVHNFEELFLKFVLFKQMSEIENGCLVGDGVRKQIDAEKFLKRDSIADRLFGTRITEVEPLLEKVDFEHHEKLLCLSSNDVLRVMRSNDFQELPPRDDGHHLIEELLAPKFLVLSE